MSQKFDEQRSANADLNFYFSSDRLFWRSPMGPMLEQARSEHFSSDGRPIPRPRSWNWLPPVGNSKPTAHIHIQGRKGGEGGGYEPDSDDIVRHGSISRRIMEISRKSPRLYDVLAAYYADRGARWAAASQDRFDRDGRLLAKGIGPGALVAIYPLTPSGRLLIQYERSASSTANRNGPRPPLPSSLTPTADTVRAALEAEIEDIRSRLSKTATAIHTAETHRSAVLREIAQVKASRTPVPTTLRDRATRTEQEIAIARAEESELKRILSLLRRTHANSATTPSLPAPILPSPDERRAWHEEYTAYMSDYEKALAQYEVDKLRRKRALVERDTVLKRLSQSGSPITLNDPRLPAVPDEPELPTKPHGMNVPTAPQARLPSLHQQRTSEVSDLSDDDVLEVSFILNRKSRGPSKRGALLDRARAEASALFVRASNEWAEISRPKRTPSTLPPNGGHRITSDSAKIATQVTDLAKQKTAPFGMAGAKGEGGRGGEGGEEKAPISETRSVNGCKKEVAA